MFKKLLIANRGEIARRINAVAKGMGIRTVAVYSDADAELPFVREADEAVRLGPAPARDSYLNIPALLEAAKSTGADAVHPGYGFVSESAEFASACQAAGITFVGPPPEAMLRMKDKSQARKLVAAAGVPVVPGTEDVLPDVEAAQRAAERIGYPVLCKAAGGGGGIGMAAANSPAELEKVFRQCTDRAKAAFGREGVYIERYFPAPRHIEVQILGDHHGHLIHGLERECSIQRRHQKVVEEAPSPLFAEGRNAALADKLFTAALTAARAFGYANAGTVEFLYSDGDIYFIEMNARLQVEHPVTELTTGLDLIGWQLRIAAGERLTVKQEDVKRRGAALEFRIYAEDPVKFLPSPGPLKVYQPPTGEGVRLDSGYVEGNTVTPNYDPMIAKLIVSGATRAEAIERSIQALEGYRIEGIKTNIPLHLRILRDPVFRAGDLNTRFLEQHAKP
ncbi:Biotin carboxylase of methylcrotonyl-CoA carboxylase [Cystobacter fuscus DSM 2262]|uniref:Biotin carboxylase of methylcrotonyl-CoA carboxylase n=1 Tax=Cystobacter fuscus (strain ATCC 25194 / DSM 2262 / NBRC 100088 / M29) TaxID=1242864 RepID=S9R239_CYSF2|nr:biotin carboxylase N-terminal domain-containing protein [Cystobacter fuscus]EPX62978.1 Biotin carboxylase of methylcrotonyl-CoA carboxylase [Cystobacter fuscus DSM 2262]WNG29468.1 ATP-grasp domain-containing protein [Cystobacter fuscus]